MLYYDLQKLALVILKQSVRQFPKTIINKWKNWPVSQTF